MADFTLVVGVDTTLSFTEMSSGIDDVVSKINKNPPQIKVKFEEASLKTMQSQLNGLLANINTTASRAPVNTAALGELAEKAGQATSAVQNMSKAMRGVSAAAKSSSDAERQLKKIADAATQARALLNKNMEASGNASYQKLSSELDKLEAVVQRCAGDSTKLSAALKEVGVDGNSAVTRINTAMATLKNELQTTGTQGTVSLRQITETYTQMQTMLNNNQRMAGTAQFSAVSEKAAEFRNVINACSGDAARLETELHKAGLNGASAIEDAKTAMASFKAELANTATASAAAAKSSSDAERSRTETVKAGAAALKAYNSLILQGEDALRKYTAAEHSKNESSRQAYSDLKRAVDAANAARNGYDRSASGANKLATANKNLSTQLKITEQVLKANGDNTKTFGERINGLASRFASWLSITQVIMLGVNAIKQAVRAAIELEDVFAQLEIVTGASSSQMAAFKDTAVGLATELGRSVSDVTKSIETFSRLGYALDDSSALAKYATVLANTAAVGTEEATTGLTSIIKGFNMDVSEAEHVADVLIEVGQKYAVSAGEMMEAYERSGAALNATNTSFEKSAGLIAAANAAVQDSAVVGTALKTISARIRGSKTDLDSLGESTEDLADGFSKYAEEIRALTGFDIVVDGTTNTFKDLYDIMQGIAAVWDDLTDTQQSRIAEILGGTRQLQVISSILGNWGDAAGAYEAAINSAGVATRANDIYMDTATAHINQFKAAFQALSSNMVADGLVSTIVDIGTGLLGIVDSASQVMNVLGSFPGLVGTIAAAMSFKNVGELINQFQLLIILRVEYAHEAYTNGNMNETMCTLAA